MRATNIQFLLQLKKEGEKIRFAECPTCQAVFGTNEQDTVTCSRQCDTELEELNRKIELTRETLYNRNKSPLATISLNTIFL